MSVVSTLVLFAVMGWAIADRNWVLVVFSVLPGANVIGYGVDHYAVGWPGSRFSSFRWPLSIRVSEAQHLLAGLVFLIVTFPPLLILHDVQAEVVVGLTALISGVWLLRFIRAMRREGWRGKPPTRSS
jgi:hypothetical protein